MGRDLQRAEYISGRKERFISVESSMAQAGTLSQNSVRCIFRDSQGGMWLGTYWED